MSDFYVDVLRQLIDEGLLRRDARVLVLCGGKYDQESLATAGFKSVTIANLDTRLNGKEFAPFDWSFQDAEQITFKDNAFDFCIVHSGLHHCHSPHRALLEIYRVAAIGVLVFEPRDNLASRLGVRLNFGQEYEVAAVFDNDCTFGGVRNTEIPNYVYRWTEREIEKTVNSFAPYGRHRFLYFYRLRLPWSRLRLMRSKLWLRLAQLAWPFLKAFTLVFPKQSNNFAFAVLKAKVPDDLQPWIRAENGTFKVNKDWLFTRYRSRKPAQPTSDDKGTA